MADDHSTELQLNHTDNNTTNTNNTSTTSTTKNKSAKIDTPKKQTPTNQLSLNKGLDNQLDIIAPPSITRPLSFLEKNNNTINIKCYFNQPHIREELTSKDDTRIQQIHKNIHKLFEDILSPSAFKIIGATAFVNCNVDKLTSIINLQNQLALNIDKLNYRFDISSNDYAIIKTFIKTYSPKHANDAITNNLTKFTSCTSIESFTVTYSYAVAFKSYIITYHLIDHTHNIVDQKIEQPSGITRYIKAATRSVTKHKIQHAKNADMATTIKNAITNPNMNKNNQPPKNNINTPPINEIANSNRNNNSLQNSGSKAILNESLDINNQSQNNNEISHKSDSSNNNNGKNSLSMSNPTDPTIVPQKPLQSQPNKPSAPTPNTINTRRSSNALTTQPVNTGAAKPSKV
uniref:Gag n=1 Tax=Dictyostelium discoideum TaxID=44689 RepID=Q9Y1H6_DICDI|nr:gag [Dictyostelium discoideum]